MELISFVEMSRMNLNKSRTRKRNFFVTSGITIILLLSVFSVWALKERNRAEGLNIKVLAEKFNLQLLILQSMIRLKESDLLNMLILLIQPTRVF